MLLRVPVVACALEFLVAANAFAQAAPAELPKEILALFQQLDELGRDKVKDARFVKVTLLVGNFSNSRESVEDAWLIAEDDKDKTVTLLQNDLLPWIYKKKGLTQIPQSWSGGSAQLKSVADGDFEAVCKTLCQPEEKPLDEEAEARRRASRIRGPGPSHRLLVAHAAWKRGLTQYPQRIVALDPLFQESKVKYSRSVLDDLAWLHFLRGVNLLKFADRRKVLPQLRLAAKLAPEAEFCAGIDDLTARIEKLAEQDEKEPPAKVDEAALNDTQKASLYVSRLKDLCCQQDSQPGFISPYFGVMIGKPGRGSPANGLKGLGMAAVPTLIEALEDETPTRTVYHWRDFHHARLVWRVSDFAWHILRDITKRDFGYRRVVGFTFSSMGQKEKQAVIAEIKQWHAKSANQSPDERMLGFFNSAKPEDWKTAAQYFLMNKDKRAVAPLLEKIADAEWFDQGDLCELVARFGDPQALPAIRDVLKNATEASARISAASALWDLGDASGVTVAIDYVKAEKQPYGSWDVPVWFLMRSHTAEGIKALESVVLTAPVPRAAEVLGFIPAAITGDLYGHKHEPAACAEVCPLLVKALERRDLTDGSINDVKIRIRDSAAKSLALLRQGWDPRFGGRFVNIDPKVFNESEPDLAKRDAQIDELKQWFVEHEGKLAWDAKSRKLRVKAAE